MIKDIRQAVTDITAETEKPYKDLTVNQLAIELNIKHNIYTLSELFNAIQNIISANALNTIINLSDLSEEKIIAHYSDSGYDFLALEIRGTYDIFVDTLVDVYGILFNNDDYSFGFCKSEFSIDDKIVNSAFVDKKLKDISELFPVSNDTMKYDWYTKRRYKNFAYDLYVPDYHALFNNTF